MKKETRSVDSNKTYLENQNTLDSRENAEGELRSLIERIDNKISELSNYMRNVSEGPHETEAIDEMNRLKYNRKQVKNAFLDVQIADDSRWMSIRERVRETFQKAEDILQQGIELS